jgi:hypothetical protein
MSQTATPPPITNTATIGILIRNPTTPAHAPSIQLSQIFARSAIRRRRERNIEKE